MKGRDEMESIIEALREVMKDTSNVVAYQSTIVGKDSQSNAICVY